LFNELLPAHVLEKTGWSPACSTLDPSVDLSGAAFKIGSVKPHTIVLVRNPRWWGQPAKVARIVIRIASSSRQLAQWLYHGVIDVSVPSSFDPGYLTDVTSMPSVKSEVDISDSFLELEFNTLSAPTSNLDVREGVAYAIDRTALVDRAVAWADVNIAPSASHLYAQSQSAYPANPPPQPANATTTTTTTTTVPTDSGPVTSADFPSTGDVLQGARALVDAGYVRGISGTWSDLEGRPLVLRLAVDVGDAWAAETAFLVADQLRQAGFSVTTLAEPSATATGQALAAGQADVALLALHASPYPNLAEAWYTPLLEIPGGTGAQDWSGYAAVKVDSLFSQAATELDPVSAEPFYTEIDQQLWADMVALPLFAEPTSLAWSDHVTGIVAGQNDGALFSNDSEWARLVTEPVTYHGTPSIGTG
jgi:peptide/nickel transport system substrate-binding protein